MTAGSRGIDRIEVTFDDPNLVTFDDPNLVANAGLLVVATLVSRLHLERLINTTVDLSGRIGGALVNQLAHPLLDRRASRACRRSQRAHTTAIQLRGLDCQHQSALPLIEIRRGVQTGVLLALHRPPSHDTAQARFAGVVAPRLLTETDSRPWRRSIPAANRSYRGAELPTDSQTQGGARRLTEAIPVLLGESARVQETPPHGHVGDPDLRRIAV